MNSSTTSVIDSKLLVLAHPYFCLRGEKPRVRLSNLANLDDFLSLLLEGMHGEATKAVGCGSSVSRDRAWNHRQKTFLNEGDYQAYLERLGRYRRQLGITVYAYCLMPNHVHLLVETGSQPLSRFVQGLQQSYTQNFNRKHRKIGHLFQGRYKAILCYKDEYLLSLVRYIHLNPIRANMVQKVDDYLYSGHRNYLEGRTSEVLDPDRVLAMIGGRAGYRGFVQAGLRDGHREDYYQVEDQRFLGTEEFAKS